MSIGVRSGRPTVSRPAPYVINPPRSGPSDGLIRLNACCVNRGSRDDDALLKLHGDRGRWLNFSPLEKVGTQFYRMKALYLQILPKDRASWRPFEVRHLPYPPPPPLLSPPSGLLLQE